MSAIVLDAGALIGLERRDPRLVALADEIVRNRVRAFVPAGVVAQTWRGSPRQHAVSKLLRAKAVTIDPLDETTAYQVGLRLAGSEGTGDVVDAHVALLARRVGGTVFTSDPDDIRALDNSLAVVPV